MRIIDMRPEITPYEEGQSRKVGKWSFTDYYQSIGGHCRDIYHCDTLMLTFVGFERTFDHDRDEMTYEWHAEPVSIGHGSVSDQGGMNQLMGVQYYWQRREMMQDYGYRYYRDNKGGGPRIEDMYGNEVL